MKIQLTLLLACCLFSLTTPAMARDDASIMPPPKRATVAAVEKQNLPGAPTTLTGTAQAFDGQILRLNGTDLRLAGIIAPALTTAEGLAARSALDNLIAGETISCKQRDRDRDGRPIMVCTTPAGKDVAEELLFSGAVLFSRTTNLAEAEATRYRAAEETAQSQRLGLWRNFAGAPAVAPKPTAPKPLPATPSPALAPATVPAAQTASAEYIPNVPAATWLGPRTTAWAQALGLLGVLFAMLLWLDARHARRDIRTHELEVQAERQSLAAALTGELAAARDICEARAAQIAAGAEPRWPRLRTYIYQAHADKIGLLGPVLARQISSIYGQMTDYAAATRDEPEFLSGAAMAKTLARLCGYIEVTLEGLAEVELTGAAYRQTVGQLVAEAPEGEAQKADEAPNDEALNKSTAA